MVYIAFSDITESLLERFKIHLKTAYKIKKKKDEPGKPLSERSIVNHLAMVRSMFSLVVKEGVLDYLTGVKNAVRTGVCTICF